MPFSLGRARHVSVYEEAPGFRLAPRAIQLTKRGHQVETLGGWQAICGCPYRAQLRNLVPVAGCQGLTPILSHVTYHFVKPVGSSCRVWCTPRQVPDGRVCLFICLFQLNLS
jgi:hypothetical protein